MRKLLPAFLLMFCVFNLLAQENEYRSTSNEFYWKNRKPFEGYWQQDVYYKIKASLNDSTDMIDGEEELTYFNNSPDTLSFVYFHLYQNAFVKGSYLEQLNLANNFKQKFGKYEAAGKGIEIVNLSVLSCNNTKLQTEEHRTGTYDDFITTHPVEVKIDFIDNTVMKVSLPCSLYPGSSIVFKIKFKTYFDGGGNQRRRMQVLKDKWETNNIRWFTGIRVFVCTTENSDGQRISIWEKNFMATSECMMPSLRYPVIM